MVTAPPVRESSTLDERDDGMPKVYLGSYMPFPGIRYYVILDEDDKAAGSARIGPIGWRLVQGTSDDAAEVSPPVPGAV